MRMALSALPHSPFQFTHPGRGATREEAVEALRQMFQFTHPGRGATGTTTST